jgi:glycosyltransferase involved in cell wall biosynthesis
MPVKVSVIISTYDNAKALRECLNALMMQSLDKSEYEVLVINDGYDQVTEHIVRSYGLYSFKYLSLSHKQGVPAAKNYGWQQAESRLIAFTEDYSTPDPGWLKTLVESYTEDLAVAFAGKIEVPLPEEPTIHQRKWAELEDASFSAVNCACTRTALEIVGGFDERYSSGWRADKDLEFKLLQQQIPVIRLDEAVVVVPLMRSSWSDPLKEQKQGVFDALLYKKFPRLYRQRIQGMPHWNYYLMVLAVVAFAVALYLRLNIVAMASIAVYALLLIGLIVGRLMFTSRKRANVLGVLSTSILIPFAFVYWQLYGSIKYRVLFL